MLILDRYSVWVVDISRNVNSFAYELSINIKILTEKDLLFGGFFLFCLVMRSMYEAIIHTFIYTVERLR